ncbi:restriction endonuclease subunit S [Thiohalocapsa marina]|uniref:restriction endonuclease subunit S n=1 Tax=Thiohalocapsa marina TaxID=424902 RepID=UPI001478A35B|nr:restriction endonuclease subunit S [Thiohalocapsa marina]
MSKEWTMKPLGEVCDILDSRRKPVTQRDRVSGPYPYYGATGILDYVDGYLFDEPLVLVGEDGAKWEAGENSAFHVDGKCWVNNHAHVLRPHRDTILDQWLIYHLNHTDLTEFVSGLTVPKLNQGNLREIPIPAAPLPEQKRIVAKLDEAFDGIAKAKEIAEKNVANARAIFESELNAIFTKKGEGWEETKLEKVLAVQPQNGWSPPAANHSDSGTPVLTLSSVTGFRFRLDKLKFTSAPTDPSRNYWVKNGDFLITRSNTPELVGHVAIASGIDTPTIYPDLIMRMNPQQDRMLSRFLYYQMRGTTLRKEITGRAHGANPTMKKISNKSVKALPVVVPPIATQSAIVEALDALTEEIQHLGSIYQTKLTELDALKQSLLHHAFTGQL